MSTLTGQQYASSKISTGKIALLIILISESVFFATLLVAYAALRNEFNWPVEHSLARLTIPFINTAIFLISLLPAWRTLISVRADKKAALQTWQITTLTLGLLFVVGQIYEFNHAGLKIDDQAFGGVFFTLMGFHALHVLAGIIILTINIIRTHLNDFSAANHEAVEIGSLFWYYVVGVWVVLFVALYFL